MLYCYINKIVIQSKLAFALQIIPYAEWFIAYNCTELHSIHSSHSYKTRIENHVQNMLGLLFVFDNIISTLWGIKCIFRTILTCINMGLNVTLLYNEHNKQFTKIFPRINTNLNSTQHSKKRSEVMDMENNKY